MSAPKGRVTTEHTVWCCCARRLGVEGMPFQTKSTDGSARDAIAVARESGWVLTREFGWLCAPCAEAWREWKAAK